MSPNPKSSRKSDDDFMILMCGNTYGFVDFKLPTPPNKQKWELLFDTTGKHKKINENGTYTLEPYSYVLLTSRQKQPDRTKQNVVFAKRNTAEYN